MGKAKITSTTAEIIKKLNSDRKKQAGRVRADFSGITENSIGVTGSSSGVAATTISPFTSGGGRISGSLSLFPKTIDVVSGVIDLKDQTLDTGNITTNTSNVNVIGEGPAADTLVTINGKSDTGQVLFLKASGYEITLQHGTGTDGLYCPGATDFVIDANNGATLIYGGTGNYWTVLGPVGGAGGGGADNLGNHIATEALKMNDSAIYFDTAQIHAIISGTNVMSYVVGDASGGKHQFFVDDLGNPKLLIDEIDALFDVNIIPDASNLTLGGSGTNEQWDLGYIDEIIFTNNTTFSSSVASIGTESGGEIVINGPTGQSIHVRHSGSDIFTVDADNIIMEKSGSTPALITCYDGFDLDAGGGDTNITDGDLNVEDGNIVLYDALLDQSIITMKYGAGAISDQYFKSDNGGLEYRTSSGTDHEFFVAGTPVGGWDDLGLVVNDGYFIQPEGTGNDTIAITPFRDTTLMTTVGTSGTIKLPQKSATVAQQTHTNLDTWFGNNLSGAGNIGCTYDSASSTGSGRYRLWCNTSGLWKGVELDVSSS
jgi:hypothetical protein